MNLLRPFRARALTNAPGYYMSRLRRFKKNKSSAHYCAERRNESLHLRSGADGNAHEVWHCGKQTAHLHTTVAHGSDDWSDFAPQINHHEVGVRRNEFVT